MPITEALLKKGLVTPEQVDEATRAKTNGERMDQLLIRSGAVAERDVLEVYAEQFAMPIVEVDESDVDREILRKVPSRLVHKYNVMPIALTRNGKSIRVATSDPFNMYALDEIRSAAGCQIEPVLATQLEIHKLIKTFYGVGGDVITEMVADAGIEVLDEHQVDSSDIDVQMAQEASVIKLVNEILLEAITQRASDIHYEPYENDFAVRYRIDGHLMQANVPPEIRRFQNAVVSRIKILSGLNIAEKRLPQDGGFKIKAKGKEIDFRVSVIPMAFGEGVVLRILDKNALSLDLGAVGMEGETLERFREVIDRPHGIVLVTGPTGSGKTTTLYSSLATIASDDLKILTIEDPIEYYLPGINQVQVLQKVGLTFARAMRSFLRHDPDVILVGEIRDRETAETAINASLTGHLVFSTLHTNDAPSATTRLIDMGVEPFLIASSVEAIMAQRLVRRICDACKEEYKPEHPEMLPPEFAYKKGETLWRGSGCKRCRNTGYAGRTAVFELMTLNDNLRELILQRKSASQLVPAAREAGMKLLSEDGWRLARKGVTTVEEVVATTKV